MSHRFILIFLEVTTLLMAFTIGKTEGTFWKKKVLEVIPDDCNCVCPQNKYIPVEVPHTQLKYYPVEEGHLTEDAVEGNYEEADDHSPPLSGYEELPDKIGRQVYEIVGSALGKGESSKVVGDEGLRKYADTKTAKPQYQSKPTKSGNEKSSGKHSHSEHSHTQTENSKTTGHSEHSHSTEEGSIPGVEGGGDDGEAQVYVNHSQDSKIKEEEPAILYHHNPGQEFDTESYDKSNEAEEPQNIDSLYGSFDSSHKHHQTNSHDDSIEAATTESLDAVYATTTAYPTVSDSFKNYHHDLNVVKKKYHKYDPSPKRRLSQKEQDIKSVPKAIVVHSKWHFFKQDPTRFKSITGGEKGKSYTSFSAYKYSSNGVGKSGSTSSPSSDDHHFIKNHEKRSSAVPSFEKEGGKGSKIVLSKVVIPSKNHQKERERNEFSGHVKKIVVTNRDAIVVEGKEEKKKSLVEVKSSIKEREEKRENKQNRINVDSNFLKEPFMVQNTNRMDPRSHLVKKDHSQIKDWETAPREDFDGSGFIFSNSEPKKFASMTSRRHVLSSFDTNIVPRTAAINPFLMNQTRGQMTFKPKPLESGPKFNILFPDYY